MGFVCLKKGAPVDGDAPMSPTTRTTPKPVNRVNGAGMPALPDRGCAYAPRCQTCPWLVCIQTLSPKKRGEFTAAWTLLRRYLAPEAVGTRPA